MKRLLLRRIVNPAMIAVWILGLTLAYVTGAYADTWLQIKFLLVLALSGLHGFFAATVKTFARDCQLRGRPGSTGSSTKCLSFWSSSSSSWWWLSPLNEVSQALALTGVCNIPKSRYKTFVPLGTHRHPRL